MAQNPRLSIPYDREWEKLRIRKVGGSFTTARAYEVRKDKYYSQNIGNEFHQEIRNKKYYGRAVLTGVDYQWSNDCPDYFIKHATFPHWTRTDWEDFFKRMYHHYPVYCIILHLEWTEVSE